MNDFAAIVGHLAWPLTALIISYLFLKELREGLLNKLLPDGGRVRAGAVEIEIIRAAGKSLRAAGVDQPVETPKEENTSNVIPEDEPYDRIIDAWRKASFVIADLASKHGGKKDARRSYENIDLLETRGLISPDVADAARNLFRARNSIRRLPSEQVTEEEASEFTKNARALVGYIEAVGK